MALLAGLAWRRIAVVMLLPGLSRLSTALDSLLYTPIDAWAHREVVQFLSNSAAAMPLLLLVTMVDNLSESWHSLRRSVAFCAAVLVGSGLSAVLFVMLRDLPSTPIHWAGVTIDRLFVVLLRFVFFGGLLTAVHFFITREHAIATAAHFSGESFSNEA